MPDPLPRRTAWPVALAIVLTVLSAGRYLLGAIPAALADDAAWDFRNCWISSRAFLDGLNPYDVKVQDQVAVRDTGARPGETVGRGNLIIIPPGNMVMFAPLALLPWRVAVGVWLAINQLALACLLYASWRLTGRGTGRTGLWLGAAALLAAHPAWEALKAGQPALTMGACTLLALLWASEGRERSAGVLLGLALLKYSLSLPALGYLVLKRRFRAALVAMGLAALLNAVPLALGDASEMMGHAMGNMEFTFDEGGVNNQKSPVASYNDVSLPVVLWRLFPTGPDAAVRAAWLAIVGLLAALLAFGGRGPGFEPLEIAALLAFSMTFVYHRVYDAPLLAGTAYGVAAAQRSGRLRPGEAIAAGLLLATFLFKNPWETWPFPLEPGYVLTRLSYRNFALAALTGLLCARVAWPIGGDRKPEVRTTEEARAVSA